MRVTYTVMCRKGRKLALFKRIVKILHFPKEPPIFTMPWLWQEFHWFSYKKVYLYETGYYVTSAGKDKPSVAYCTLFGISHKKRSYKFCIINFVITSLPKLPCYLDFLEPSQYWLIGINRLNNQLATFNSRKW